MGPSQYPQYTRAWLAKKAVGSSQTKHHSTPPAHPTRDESLAWYHGLRDHDNGVTVSVTEEVVVPAARPLVEEIAILHAADPDADGKATDREVLSSCAPVMVPEVVRPRRGNLAC